MTKKLFVSVSAGAAMLLLSTIFANGLDRRDEARAIDRMGYEVRAEQVYEGTVASKGHVVDGLVYFALRMPDSRIEIQIGPEDFVEHSGFKIKIGSMITVTGVPLVWNDRDVVLAREVRNMNSILVVRDRDGYPMWEMNSPAHMDPELLPSHLCELIGPRIHE